MSEKRKTVGIGLLGSGTVGEAVQDFIFDGLKGRVGGDLQLEIVKVYTRRPRGKKWQRSRPSLFTANPHEVVDHPKAEIIIEALGFQQERQLGGFKDLIVRALKNGKAVVTSDKAVLAKYGKEIWEAVEKHRGELRFEACVAGGVPIIRSLRESFAAEEPEAIYGIVNGTCNYILSEMGRNGKSYGAALREAQQRGYAETNPSADTSGRDAEAKLILLAGVAFGLYLKPSQLWRKGIEEIHALDFLYAAQKGRSTIKQLVMARRKNRFVEAYISPVLVPEGHVLAAIDGATNAVFFKGKKSGEAACGWNYLFAGPGAGGGPTAVAILGDVCELARGRGRAPRGPLNLLRSGSLAVLAKTERIRGSFYVRLVVKDRAGIVGDICQTLGKAGINVSEIWQLDHSREEREALARSCRIKEDPQTILPFVITLERAAVGQVMRALKAIEGRSYILAKPLWFPIWRNE